MAKHRDGWFSSGMAWLSEGWVAKERDGMVKQRDGMAMRRKKVAKQRGMRGPPELAFHHHHRHKPWVAVRSSPMRILTL